QLGQGQQQHAAPQLVGGAVGERPGVLADALQAGAAPGGGAARRRQSLADEDRADAVLGGDATADQGLAVSDEGAPLPRLLVRDDGGGELAQREELGQSQGVVLVGLAPGVLELPGLGGGVGDVAGQAECGAQVVDPAGQGTGLDDHGGGSVASEE